MSKTPGMVSRFAAAMGFQAEDPKGDDKDKAGKKAKPARLDGESDEDYDKRCEEEEKKDEAKGGQAGAETDDDKKKDEDAKKAAHAASFAQGVAAERERWGIVLSASEAAGRGILACTFLADTEMSAADIRKSLAKQPEQAPVAKGLAGRMAAEAAVIPKPTPGASEALANPQMASAQQIVAAAALARGEKPAAA